MLRPHEPVSRHQKTRASNFAAIVPHPRTGGTHMTGEIDAIEKVVWTYLDGLYEGDTRKLGQVFHEVSHLYSLSDGGVADVPREKWFEMVKNRPSAKAKGLGRTDRIVSIDL